MLNKTLIVKEITNKVAIFTDGKIDYFYYGGYCFNTGLYNVESKTSIGLLANTRILISPTIRSL